MVSTDQKHLRTLLSASAHHHTVKLKAAVQVKSRAFVLRVAAGSIHLTLARRIAMETPCEFHHRNGRVLWIRPLPPPRRDPRGKEGKAVLQPSIEYNLSRTSAPERPEWLWGT